MVSCGTVRFFLLPLPGRSWEIFGDPLPHFWYRYFLDGPCGGPFGLFSVFRNFGGVKPVGPLTSPLFQITLSSIPIICFMSFLGYNFKRNFSQRMISTQVNFFNHSKKTAKLYTWNLAHEFLGKYYNKFGIGNVIIETMRKKPTKIEKMNLNYRTWSRIAWALSLW